MQKPTFTSCPHAHTPATTQSPACPDTKAGADPAPGNTDIVGSLTPLIGARMAAVLAECCREGHTLDFNRLPLDDTSQDLPYDLTADTVRTLQSAVRAATGCDIRTVKLDLGSRSLLLPSTVLALNQLEALEELVLTVPRPHTIIDLGDLIAARRVTVTLNCTRSDEWQVRVPDGTRVRALGPSVKTCHATKPMVIYLPSRVSAAVPGLVYQREPKEFQQALDPNSRLLAIEQARANRNMAAQFRAQDHAVHKMTDLRLDGRRNHPVIRIGHPDAPDGWGVAHEGIPRRDGSQQ